MAARFEGGGEGKRSGGQGLYRGRVGASDYALERTDFSEENPGRNGVSRLNTTMTSVRASRVGPAGQRGGERARGLCAWAAS